MGQGREGGSRGRGKINQCGKMIVIRKNKSDAILDLFFFFTLNFVCYCFCYKNAAYSLKCAALPILKALTFKGITLFHSYRDKKLKNRE